MHAMDEATDILALDPYELTLGRIPIPINSDKKKIKLARFMNLSTGGICRVMHDQTIFHQLHLLISQFSDEKDEIGAALPLELREQFRKIFDDYHNIFNKYRFHLD